MLSPEIIRARLAAFGVSPSDPHVIQVCAYLDLLLRWNKSINLTALSDPEEILTRHFGESFIAGNLVEFKGRLLDIGSGAGFPGLALKIPFPDLQATLLEPVAKKRVFLKEVARVCGLKGVEIRGERLEVFADTSAPAQFDVVTARAVGNLQELVPIASRCLMGAGHICLWLSVDQIAGIVAMNVPITWSGPCRLPHSDRRVILVGTRT